MLSRSAIVKLKAILVIDLIIVSAAIGAYLYLENEGLITGAARPAEFNVSDLIIDPAEVEPGEPILITLNVSNIGDVEGVYSANLTINNELREQQEILIDAKSTLIVEFTVLESNEGDYDVEIDGLIGFFKIKPAPPEDSNIVLSNFKVTPYEGWVDEQIIVTLSAHNPSGETDIITLRLTVDGTPIENKRIELLAGESTTVEFTFTATKEGKFIAKVNTLSGTFFIVPTGYHTLTVNRSGGGSKPLTFTLNGVEHNTPYSQLLPIGEYTLSAPNIVDVGTGVLEFSYWSDGSRSGTRSINLQNRMIIVATYTVISGYASCPSLYFWNGTHYVYVTEVSNAGWLGYIDHITKDGDIVFGGGNPWDNIKLDNNQLFVKDVDGDGYFDLVLFQQWDEIFYLDAVYMLVVDHSVDTDVYATMPNYVNQIFNDKIYTVSKNNILTPISATNEKGQDVLPYIAELDGIFTPGINGLKSPAWNNMTLNQLTLNLGDLSNAQEIKLVIHGMVDWGEPEPYYDWIEQFIAAVEEGLITGDTQIYPPPYMEVMDANGDWVLVPQDRQMPIPSDYVPRSFVVDLTGLFPEGIKEYQIRMVNFWNVTFDYIGIDITTQEDIIIQTIKPTAIFEPIEFGLTASTASGSFTRYGDVTALLQEADDMYIIGMQGDKVSMKFSIANLEQVPEGMERDYFLFVACWFKDPPGNWGYGFEFTVDPLPFIAMSGFPYLSNETYPYDDVRLAYLEEYNTRYIAP
jgi:hypothetical protein